ncbi:MAG: RIP metalloprotease RseP [Candidatus Omnitrophica bacterium]|nr:RIP metalloprotease RseP [Candidatus Omnitrophota bacterium]MCM8828328.1 RIP metalloprotease RseP [Candidatus Omnitrophota bacterium]
MFIISIFIVFGVVILIHEYGHFWVAKKLGVRVEKFSFGFGPKLISWKKNGTEYLISLVPFGGYVKMAGEDTVESKSPDEYIALAPGKRALIVASGAIHNILIAYVFLIPALMLGISRYDGTVIGGLQKGFPAEVAGLKAGDRVVSVNGIFCKEWFDVVKNITEQANVSPDRPIIIEVQRDLETLKIPVVARLMEKDRSMFKGKKRYIIGIMPKEVIVRYGFWNALIEAGKEYIRMFNVILISFKLLFTGQVSFQELSGPVGISRMTIEIVKAGIASFLYFIAFININLGLVNLFPFFILDGGHLVGLLGEKILGRKPGKKVLEIGQLAGIAFLIILVVLVTYNDIIRILTEKISR